MPNHFAEPMQTPVHRWGRGQTMGDAMGEGQVEGEASEEEGEMERAGGVVDMDDAEMGENRGERLFDVSDGEERMAVDEAGLGRPGLQEDEGEEDEMGDDDGGDVDMWGQAVPPELQYMAGMMGGGGGRPGGQG